MIEYDEAARMAQVVERRDHEGELRLAAAADHDAYIAEVVRARDRAIALRELLPAHLPTCDSASPTGICPAAATLLQVVAAMDSQFVIDYAQLHHQLDLAEAHVA